MEYPKPRDEVPHRPRTSVVKVRHVLFTAGISHVRDMQIGYWPVNAGTASTGQVARRTTCSVVDPNTKRSNTFRP